MSPHPLIPGGDLGRNDIYQTTPLHTLKTLKVFRVVHLNIVSLPKHLDELKLLFEGKPVDVISINETRLDNTVDDPEMSIPGYDLFRKDRSSNGGGVALYIRKIFNTINKTHIANVDLEAVCVEILKPKAKPILIATVYRPPNSGSDYMSNLECFLHELDNDNKEIIFTGDLNCDFLSDVHQAHTHKLTES